ncbi:PQQ-dependent sugar dehydrogenase [Acidimangrovimonas sediminis]|uniref:PQQ-dependent sugar dehydrogenase n=1 Tax=Acidimangrovimonas sediminis TaxID=2056283 RepID=UPI000C8063B2|nr:PQQ-dependent sugar dehydrogenase [Acidimangrovimonas sediminis]
MISARLRLGAGAALGLALSLGVSPAVAEDWSYGQRNVPDFKPAFAGQTRAPKLDSGVRVARRVVARGLTHPWGIAVLPEGGYLVTERSGALRPVSASGRVGAPVKGVPAVVAQGQGGLLDVALAPDFDQTRVIYLTYAKRVKGGVATAAARAVLSADATRLVGVRDLFVQSPASPTTAHFGSRIVADGAYLYLTTGEHFTERQRQFAQDPGKTYGKVIRIRADGAAPADNPFPRRGPKVWSYGHRNPQGLALRPGTEELWEMEHGPRGGDELNLIRKGGNYGWPVVSYGENYSGSPVGSGKAHAKGMIEPRYYWDPVIAPSGFTFYEGAMFPGWKGDILAASLSPGGLVRLKLKGDRVVGEERFLYGRDRVRDVAVDRDGAILILTDQEDGQLIRLVRE